MFPLSRPIPQAMLSPREILEISQEISRNYAPIASLKSAGRTTKFIFSPKELLAISEEITRKYTPKINSNKPNLVLLPVDPGHLYAAWHLGDAQITSATNDESYDVVLRIYPKPDEDFKINRTNPWFDVDIDQTKNRQKIPVPKGHSSNTYTAAIGKRDQEDRLTIFAASSKDVHIPRGSMASYQSGESEMLPSSASQSFSSNQEKLPETGNNASDQGVK